MITAIIGLHGSGKTWFMVNKFLYPHWKAGGNILTFNQLFFSPENERIERFWQLNDLYTANNVLIGFPELQKLLNAGAWRSLPTMFIDLLCQHRHSQVNIVGDTQDLMQVDIQLRRHIAELFVCQSIFRFPKDETKPAIIHWIKVQKKIRRFDTSNDRVLFKSEGWPKFYFISLLWTKKLYDTFEKSNLSRYLLWALRKDKKWTIKMASRQLVSAGKVRKK